MIKIICTSKILKYNKITLRQEIAERLNVHQGGSLVFLESPAGDIIIRNSNDVNVAEVKK